MHNLRRACCSFITFLARHIELSSTYTGCSMLTLACERASKKPRDLACSPRPSDYSLPPLPQSSPLGTRDERVFPPFTEQQMIDGTSAAAAVAMTAAAATAATPTARAKGEIIRFAHREEMHVMYNIYCVLRADTLGTDRCRQVTQRCLRLNDEGRNESNSFSDFSKNTRRAEISCSYGASYLVSRSQSQVYKMSRLQSAQK